MPKAASPVRLQEELMESARISGSIQHRSAAKQIEYWADLGRKVSKAIDPDPARRRGRPAKATPASQRESTGNSLAGRFLNGEFPGHWHM